MKVLAIDPGKEGGVAIYDGKNLILETMFMTQDNEYDWPRFAEWIKAQEVDFAFVELQIGRPGQNSVGTFSQGYGYGGIIAMLSVLRIPYQIVSPQAWTAAAHKGIVPVYKDPKEGEEKRKKDTKATSRIAVQRLFPGVSFLATAKSKKMHEGLVDAALIALYGWRLRNA